jgi:hypothetical protein
MARSAILSIAAVVALLSATTGMEMPPPFEDDERRPPERRRPPEPLPAPPSPMPGAVSAPPVGVSVGRVASTARDVTLTFDPLASGALTPTVVSRFCPTACGATCPQHGKHNAKLARRAARAKR